MISTTSTFQRLAVPFSVHPKSAAKGVIAVAVNIDGSIQEGGAADVIVGEEKQKPHLYPAPEGSSS